MSDSPIDFINSLSLEDLEIHPWHFTDQDRNDSEKWCKDFHPYWCPFCHSMTMLDRGKRFQCQLCSTEYECGDQTKMDEWRRNVKKKLMGSL